MNRDAGELLDELLDVIAEEVRKIKDLSQSISVPIPQSSAIDRYISALLAVQAERRRQLKDDEENAKRKANKLTTEELLAKVQAMKEGKDG